MAAASASRPWANGPSVPLTTPMRADESIDHEAIAKQVVRLAQAGVGIVLLGTNGEGECYTIQGGGHWLDLACTFVFVLGLLGEAKRTPRKARETEKEQPG